MSCDHQFVIEHIDDYLAQSLDAKLSRKLTARCELCSECQLIVDQSLHLKQAAQDWQDQEVMPWHRTSYAAKPHRTANHWLSWSALATSSLAIFMMFFQMSINYNPSGFQISFASGPSKQQIQDLVATELVKYQQQQNELFSQKMLHSIEKQDAIATLRLAEWLEKNRIERQQDIRFVMTGWQSQRYRDQKTVDQQLSYIAENQIANNQAINQLLQTTSIQDER